MESVAFFFLAPGRQKETAISLHFHDFHHHLAFEWKKKATDPH